MVRAVATATTVARELDLPLVAWPEIHEVGGIHQRDPESGERMGLPGPNRAFFEAQFPDLHLPPSLGETGWWNSRPYEVHEEAAARARALLNQLLERHGDRTDRVAFVSHGGFYRHLMRAILGLSPDAPVSFSLNNGAITRIDFWDWGAQVVYANRLDYLPRNLVS
jgi:2,3-bisphosphoglycerate-dependent phosphoglycerate mutase